MIKVVLLGSGNVAYHLALALKSAPNIELVQRYSRNDSSNAYFDADIPFTDDLRNLERADIYVIAIKDDAIEDVSGKLSDVGGLVVHTSGSIPVDLLHPGLRRGVLYPVQTLSLLQKIDFREVPLAIEVENPADESLLLELSSSLSNHVYKLSSAEREKLHVSAVFANNFSNFMFICAASFCAENNIPFDILKPMILETGKKVQYLNPIEAQTGPARRNDQLVINRHLHELEGERHEIYKLLSAAITTFYQPKMNQHGEKL